MLLVYVQNIIKISSLHYVGHIIACLSHSLTEATKWTRGQQMIRLIDVLLESVLRFEST